MNYFINNSQITQKMLDIPLTDNIIDNIRRENNIHIHASKRERK